jgi:hypothetical protein
MKRLIRIGTSSPEASTSALRISATTPASGVTFIDNSRGASAATANLSAALDSVLKHLDLSSEHCTRRISCTGTFDEHTADDFDEQLRSLVHLLDQEAATYSNSTVDEKECVEWAWYGMRYITHPASSCFDPAIRAGTN